MNPIRRTRPIPADGLERALRDGRHRRRKAAAVAGAPALSLVVALVLVLQGGPGDKDSIGTLNDPEGTSTATAEPTATETPSLGESAEPSTGEEAEPDSSAEPASEAECDSTDDCSGDGDEDSYTYSTPAPHGDPMPRTDSHQTLPYTQTSCATAQYPPSEYKLCTRAYAVSSDLTISPGETVTVGYEVCRGIDAKTTDLELQWDSGQEHEAYVRTSSSSGTPVWRESDVTAWMGGPHSDTLRQQTCFVWTFSWQGYGSDGLPVDAGTYLLSGVLTTIGGPPRPSGVQVTVTR